ncbi:unnamed protein product [Rotaria magnacalcarata]|uniref:Uncharacterized protein n=2 Tax=Rotaria magnacalcarata TaxID=392030 RepID=A0A816UKQ9_9BILA|nr:unnamed protein product [Rotaria magnacalcarata]CAF2110312.1 unnamed protein product [Rotaria magnacalcarata]
MHSLYSYICFCIAAVFLTLCRPSNCHFGYQVAKRMGMNDTSNTQISSFMSRNDNVDDIKFAYNGGTHINGWWCVRLYDNAVPTNMQHVCTNKDVGLIWRWNYQSCQADMKCASISEPIYGQIRWWNDNAFCLPKSSKIEMIWSFCGSSQGGGWSCIQVPLDGFTNNFLCWRQHRL